MERHTKRNDEDEQRYIRIEPVVDCPRRESDADEKEKQGEEEELPVQMSPETNGFTGEKIVFLLAEYDKQKKAFRYSVLENSTLPPNDDRLKKLRTISRSSMKKRSSK